MLLIVLFLVSCNSRTIQSKNTKTINISDNTSNTITLHHYQGKKSQSYRSAYYWYPKDSVALCGFYIFDKTSKEIKEHIVDYQTCAYESEDAYSIDNAKILEHFRKQFEHQIVLAEKKYFLSQEKDVLDKAPLGTQEKHRLLKSIADSAKIVFLEVVGVKTKDTLHIRKTDSSSSKRIVSLENHSKKLFTLQKEMQQAKHATWLKVYYFDEERYTYQSGWAKKSFVKSTTP